MMVDGKGMWLVVACVELVIDFDGLMISIY